ncbi:hypothetical protein PSN45_001411 [Yamadazyma tenuis]|uniref:Uncharacterized protein n=1 Tax=Candida tenuis (strain ATCC 10573 / BCRC 21748 / CBS 615 / JCM 9827 / NBRC 10315 / NRRL Y-1498 / VKM Y-70) TaxID=590646 RepID=G3BCC1_CANTC|nr:uncharacterized protein CANTEDRAFT_116868 [Yamadazyma tenuis ATCC 10573]EGV60799.1 hypothetical protein CANTEDRAFT_116868 [Yamadazyma tenuis ATCC 10573]WEJ93934.1 hypothetical protein PSN45_001411 [Yamadazyma tenuis]
MTDFAFDNYCINCEKMCSTNSIYCSEACKRVDESNTQRINSTFVPIDHIASPLLSPNYNYNYSYQGQDSDYTYSYTASDGSASDNYYIPLDSIDEINLNYSLSESANNIVSTSHNYKKWLTGTCL